MAVPAHLSDQIDQFLAAIAPMREAYEGIASFSYLAVSNSGGDALIRGTLYLNIIPANIPFGEFRSASIRAGHVLLKDIGLSLEEFIVKLGEGALPIPSGKLDFSPNDNGLHGARFIPFHDLGIQNQRRLPMLTIMGRDHSGSLPQPHIDWELRAAPTPFDGLAELVAEYQPGAMYGVAAVDIAALAVVYIDASATVQGTEARIALRKAFSARPEKITLRYRLIDHGVTVYRGSIPSESIEWAEDGICGTAVIEVTAGTVVHGVACYDGVGQHHYFVADPAFFQNPRRATFETFDPKLETLRNVLLRAQTSKADGRAFEAAISWVTWMLGFSPTHLCSPFSEVPDVLLSAPSGDIAIVECTTGVFDIAKLGRLNTRTMAARTALVDSKMGHLKALPLLVTSLSREEAKPGIEQAKTMGILVLTREDIDNALQRTVLWPNADQIYARGWQALQAIQQLPIQPNLPGS